MCIRHWRRFKPNGSPVLDPTYQYSIRQCDMLDIRYASDTRLRLFKAITAHLFIGESCNLVKFGPVGDCSTKDDTYRRIREVDTIDQNEIHSLPLPVGTNINNTRGWECSRKRRAPFAPKRYKKSGTVDDAQQVQRQKYFDSMTGSPRSDVAHTSFSLHGGSRPIIVSNA